MSHCLHSEVTHLADTDSCSTDSLHQQSQPLPALGVGSNGSGAIEVTKYDAQGQNPTRVNRLDLTETGVEIGLANKFAAENHLDALASGTTILDFANSCKVTSDILCAASALPSDAPVASEGHIVVLASGGGQKTVLFIPAENAGCAVYTRAIANNAWRGTGWTALISLDNTGKIPANLLPEVGGGFVEYAGTPPESRKANTLYAKVLVDLTGTGA